MKKNGANQESLLTITEKGNLLTFNKTIRKQSQEKKNSFKHKKIHHRKSRKSFGRKNKSFKSSSKFNETKQKILKQKKGEGGFASYKRHLMKLGIVSETKKLNKPTDNTDYSPSLERAQNDIKSTSSRPPQTKRLRGDKGSFLNLYDPKNYSKKNYKSPQISKLELTYKKMLETSKKNNKGNKTKKRYNRGSIHASVSSKFASKSLFNNDNKNKRKKKKSKKSSLHKKKTSCKLSNDPPTSPSHHPENKKSKSKNRLRVRSPKLKIIEGKRIKRGGGRRLPPQSPNKMSFDALENYNFSVARSDKKDNRHGIGFPSLAAEVETVRLAGDEIENEGIYKTQDFEIVKKIDSFVSKDDAMLMTIPMSSDKGLNESFGHKKKNLGDDGDITPFLVKSNSKSLIHMPKKNEEEEGEDDNDADNGHDDDGDEESSQRNQQRTRGGVFDKLGLTVRSQEVEIIDYNSKEKDLKDNKVKLSRKILMKRKYFKPKTKYTKIVRSAEFSSLKKRLSIDVNRNLYKPKNYENQTSLTQRYKDLNEEFLTKESIKANNNESKKDDDDKKLGDDKDKKKLNEPEKDEEENNIKNTKEKKSKEMMSQATTVGGGGKFLSSKKQLYQGNKKKPSMSPISLKKNLMRKINFQPFIRAQGATSLITKSVMREQRKIKKSLKLSSCQDRQSFDPDLKNSMSSRKDRSSNKLRELFGKANNSQTDLSKVKREKKKVSIGDNRQSHKEIYVSAKSLKKRNERLSLNFRRDYVQNSRPKRFSHLSSNSASIAMKRKIGRKSNSTSNNNNANSHHHQNNNHNNAKNKNEYFQNTKSRGNTPLTSSQITCITPSRSSSYQKYLNNHLNALSSTLNIKSKYIEKISMQLKLAEELVQTKKDFETFVKNIEVPENLYYISKMLNAVTKKVPFRNSRQYYDHFVQIVDSVKYMIVKRKQIDGLSYQGKMVNLPKQIPNEPIKKTLILDLDETLVHCDHAAGNGGNNFSTGKSNLSSNKVTRQVVDIQLENGNWVKAWIAIRPYAKELLRDLSKYYEILIFTASQFSYANKVIDLLDPDNKYISYRLFRHHCCSTREGIFIKDLRILKNREMKDLVIVDNSLYCYGYQIENGVPVIPFYDDKDDTELVELYQFLMRLLRVSDVRPFISNYFKYNLYELFHNNQTELIKKLMMAYSVREKDHHTHSPYVNKMAGSSSRRKWKKGKNIDEDDIHEEEGEEEERQIEEEEEEKSSKDDEGKERGSEEEEVKAE